MRRGRRDAGPSPWAALSHGADVPGVAHRMVPQRDCLQALAPPHGDPFTSGGMCWGLCPRLAGLDVVWIRLRVVRLQLCPPPAWNSCAGALQLWWRAKDTEMLLLAGNRPVAVERWSWKEQTPQIPPVSACSITPLAFSCDTKLSQALVVFPGWELLLNTR